MFRRDLYNLKMPYIIDVRFHLLYVLLPLLNYHRASSGIECYMWKRHGDVIRVYTFCDDGSMSISVREDK